MARQQATGDRPRRIARGQKIFELVARDIVRQIGSGQMAAGSVLAPEAQMLAEYEVGRASLREALRVLEAHGLVSIKPGPRGGPVVAGVNSRDFGRMATLYFQVRGATFRELTEARLVMEPVMARLAAQRRDHGRMAELQRVLDESREASLSADDVYLRATRDFHSVIAGMSGNRILDLYGRALKDIFTERVTGLLFPASQRDHIRRAHEAIAKAIFNGEAARAERLMREHMQEYVEYVQRRHPGLLDEVVDWR
jgi:DNA-binding FadR family transcriptional regulator